MGVMVLFSGSWTSITNGLPKVCGACVEDSADVSEWKSVKYTPSEISWSLVEGAMFGRMTRQVSMLGEDRAKKYESGCLEPAELPRIEGLIHTERATIKSMFGE